MSRSFMIETQQYLASGVAVRLAAARHERRLVVTEGRLWLTGEGIDGDLWLRAGESVTLPAGVRPVGEGWPSARFQLCRPAPRVRPAQRRQTVAGSEQPACA